jgi:hypothetical protein
MKIKPASWSVFATAVLIFAVFGTIGYGVFNSPQYPINLRKVKTLRHATTQDDVKRLFGAPQQVFEIGTNIYWSYYRSNQFTHVYLIFNTNMNYSGYELDD